MGLVSTWCVMTAPMNLTQATTFVLVNLINLLLAVCAPITYTFVVAPVLILTTERRQRKNVYFLLTVGEFVCVLMYPDNLYIVMCALFGFWYSWY